MMTSNEKRRVLGRLTKALDDLTDAQVGAVFEVLDNDHSVLATVGRIAEILKPFDAGDQRRLVGAMVSLLGVSGEPEAGDTVVETPHVDAMAPKRGHA
jgi:hypothetical protein